MKLGRTDLYKRRSGDLVASRINAVGFRAWLALFHLPGNGERTCGCHPLVLAREGCVLSLGVSFTM
jgi:hypothetical protein